MAQHRDRRLQPGCSRILSILRRPIHPAHVAGATSPGVQLPALPLDQETVAAIIRITGGNFRLLNRLLTQIERILEVNTLQEVNKAVVEAGRESLVIWQAS